MFDAILIVCSGNICRSPIGERILRRLLPQKRIDSAGITASIGLSADAGAMRIANQQNLLLDGHRSRRFTPEIAAQYDLILVMEKRHIERITDMAPEVRSKSMLLGYWLNRSEIPDPWRKSDEAFGYVYQLIDSACRTWASKLDG
jgi:protein-tyrosine phosphatase